MHHLRRGDYSGWFRHVIKDKDLAEETAGIEANHGVDARESLRQVEDAVARRYTMPAGARRD
jgi:hypothetical protein